MGLPGSLSPLHIEISCIIEIMDVFEGHAREGRCLPDLSLANHKQLRIPRRNRNLQRTEGGCLIMSERNLQIICEADGLYEYPEMNKKLYLHYKVIEQISGLNKYVNLKTLYLQNNVISKIQNLECLTQLQNLFLQNNMIKQIQNLQKLKELKVLNLAHNTIFNIRGLSELLLLQSLTLSQNYLSDFGSLEHLGQCSVVLTSIDLTDNKIVPDDRLFDLIQQVKCLYLMGNPLVREVLHYRRTLVGKLKSLMYLDQRAVDQQERILAESWIADGQVGFKKAKQSILAIRKERKQEAREAIMQNIDVHRKKKINVFERNILQFEQQIQKLRGYMRQPENADQIFFYESRVAELMQRIRENQQFIDAIYKRMGIEPPPPVYTLKIIEQKEGQMGIEEMKGEGMFQIRENQAGEAASEGASEQGSESASQQGSNNSESIKSNRPSQSSSSQQDSVKTYYSLQQLD